jgi:CRISPR type III-A-associated RAMP protein Csm4
MSKRTFTTYLLYFKTPLHIGDVRPDDYGKSETFIRSDTFVAAITAMLGKMERIAETWNGKFDFQISSLFPFTTVENEAVYFFPKLSKPFLLQKEISFAKKMKKLQWIDVHYFETQLNDFPFDDFGDDKQSHIQGAFCSKHKISKFIESQVSQRVRIPRERALDENPDPFYMERLFFKEGSGLFLLAVGDDFKLLEDALNLLQYEGLGTDRTVGNGAFEWKKKTLEILVPEGDYCTNLSLFCPEDKSQLENMLDEKSTYDLIKRGGWITTEGFQTYRKKAIYMFAEGSIFKGNSDKKGTPNIDLTPDATFIETQLDHKIYRSGQSIFLPVKI